jgi:hypothetical protein
MGHRALLAYRRDADSTDESPTDSTAVPDHSPDESTDTSGETTDSPPDDSTDQPTYDLHRSHWGGADFALVDHLSADAPFAANTHFAVDPEPVATDLSTAQIASSHLDFLHHEAFYRVSPEYEVTAFHVLWFGLEADSETVERSETVGHGALVEAVPADANYLRGWFRGTKAVIGDLVDRDALSRDEATRLLAGRVETWAADREVILPD